MAFKFVCFAALLAIARAGNIAAPLAYAATPLATPIVKAAPIAAIPAVPVAKTVVDAEYDPHPQYNYAYDIQDAITGDNKGHQEIRDGDVVQGRYYLIDADGTRRTVEYTADPINGFNAVVHREPLTVAAPLVKTVAAAPVVTAPVLRTVAPAPILPAAPIAARFTAPVFPAAPLAARFAAPVAPVAYAAPVAKIATPVAAPLAYTAGVAAPVAPLAYAAPVTKTIIH